MGENNIPKSGSHKQCLAGCLLLLCLLFSSFAFAEPLLPILKVVHVENSPSLQKTIPDAGRFKALDQALLHFDADLSDAYWVRPVLPNELKISAGHLFTIGPSNIHQIDMYIPELARNRAIKNVRRFSEIYIPELADNQAIKSVSRFSVDTSPKFSHRAIVFEVPDDYIAGQNIFFYLQARSDENVTIEYWEHDNYLVADRKYSSFYSALFASLFILVLINLIFFIAIREIDYLAYVCYLSSILLFIMLTTGKIYEFNIGKLLAGNYNSILFLYSLTCLTLTIFVQRFLQLKKYTPFFYILTQIYTVFYLGVIIMSLAVWPVPYIAFNIINYTALFAFPFLIFCSIKIWVKGLRQAKYFMLAFIPLIAMMILRILAILGYIPNWDLATDGFEVAAAFQGLVLTVGLADQMLELRKQRDAAEVLSSNATSSLQIEKDFSKFLARIGEEIRLHPNANHDELIISSFFNRLDRLYNIKKAAIVFQVDAELKIMSDNTLNQSAFDDYVHDHLTDVSRICHKNELKELAMFNHPLFMRFTKMLVIPVHMRGHEWSGLLLNLELTRSLSAQEYETLQRYATELVRTLVNAHNLEHFSVKAETDGLTQVMNRGAILDVLAKEIKDFRISRLPLSIAFLDIDHFKEINDTLGHEAGDTCLAYLALQIRRYLPETASVGRMGGDEFLFVFPDYVTDQANEILARLCSSLETLIIDDVECSFTLSIGIAQYKYPEMDLKLFLRHADETLYKSKENGRARITVAA